MRGIEKMGVKISTFRKNFHTKSKPNKFAVHRKKLEQMKCKTSPRIKPNVRILIFGACTPIQHGRLVVKLVYWTKKYVFVDNFSLKHGNNFIFSDIEVNDKINISWNFCENLSLWRHITSLPVFRRGTCHGHLSKRWPKIGVFDSGTKFGDSKLKKAPNVVKTRKKIIRVKFRPPTSPPCRTIILPKNGSFWWRHH